MSAPPRLPLGLTLPEGLARRRDDRYAGGVCSGVARWLSVDPTMVRLAFVLLTLANGVGLLLYLVAWVLMPEDGAAPAESADGDGRTPTAVDPAASAARPAASASARRDAKRRSLEHAVALGCITFGVLLLVRWATPFFPDELVWPATCAAAGAGVVWARADETERARWRNDPLAALSGRGLALRLFCGGALLICGIGWFMATSSTFKSLGHIGMAVLATVLGIAVLLGPWLARARQQMIEERRERIRSEERADMAAHLHDSVLQTLALIQRQAESPQQARSLARRQERELRAWLFEDRTPDDGGPLSLSSALDRVSDDVEAHHDVTVDVVVVGDRPLDHHIEALLNAVREAVVNAARHSGEPEVSVYVEVGDGEVEAFVRDRGKGFDPSSVDGDRRGIADSIVGRMVRHGGTAKVRSAPGEGTEVALRLPIVDLREVR